MSSKPAVDLESMTYAEAMKDREARYLIAVLEAAELNRKKAAKMAGLQYATFNRKVSALNLKFKVVQLDV